MDKKESTFLSIIIPTKDREEILSETLTQLYKAFEELYFEVIVVNDSKSDLSLTSPTTKVTRNPGQGVAAARNHGASIASGDYFIFLDDDMLVNPNIPKAISNWFIMHPDSCVNANWVYPEELQKTIATEKFGRFLNRYGFTSLKGWNRGHFWDDSATFQTISVTSQFLWISRDNFQKIGGYNDQFPFAGFEDYDLTMRLNNHGVNILIDPLAVIHHNERDRATNMEAWMARRQRGGKTRRVAVDLGYQELTLNYPWLKSTVYKLVNRHNSMIYGLIGLIPNRRLFDNISFFMFNMLYGAAVYQGYFGDK